MSNLNYSLQHPQRLIDRLALKKRQHMFQLFLQSFPEVEQQTVLDVGVTADQRALSSNFFEKLYPYKEKLIALSNQNASFLQNEYPGLRFQKGDATALPFADKSIDVVFSAAVIEHIGSLQQQKKMIAECFRVAKKGVFITTPNRWHPLEVHTLMPLIHWLPKHLHRFLLRRLGLHFYAEEKNLNLLDKKTLQHICSELNIETFSIRSIVTFGFKSNLILIIQK